MKNNPLRPSTTRSGQALILVIFMTALILAGVAAALFRTTTNVALNERSNQYYRTLAAAEAATEKVLSTVTQDYLTKGDKLVASRLSTYRMAVPTSVESGRWANWEFTDTNGTVARASVDLGASASFIDLDSMYKGLKGFVTPLTVAVQARELNSSIKIVTGIRQQVQLAVVPVFQFAMFSTLDMEIGCGQPFTISGRVHSNKELYVEPISTLTFKKDVTAAGNILYQRHPLDPRIAPYGATIYEGRKDSKVAALYLPIGVDNTPAAVREIIHPPLSAEDPESSMGRQRFYNKADLIVVVSNSFIRVSSGRFNDFLTTVPTNEVALFVRTNASFHDPREAKTVRPVDVDVGLLRQWGLTNTNVRVALGNREVSSVYVWDQRSFASTELAAVRLNNGVTLPSDGLTVATARPLYVVGHYNQPNPLRLGTG